MYGQLSRCLSLNHHTGRLGQHAIVRVLRQRSLDFLALVQALDVDLAYRKVPLAFVKRMRPVTDATWQRVKLVPF